MGVPSPSGPGGIGDHLAQKIGIHALLHEPAGYHGVGPVVSQRSVGFDKPISTDAIHRAAGPPHVPDVTFCDNPVRFKTSMFGTRPIGAQVFRRCGANLGVEPLSRTAS